MIDHVIENWLQQLDDLLQITKYPAARAEIEFDIRRLRTIRDNYESIIAEKDAIIASYEIDAKHNDLQNFLDWAEKNMPDEDEE